MENKICPFLSTGQPTACLRGDCMLYLEKSDGTGACGLVKAPQRVAAKIDILSAQIQEMQVGLIEINNKMTRG